MYFGFFVYSLFVFYSIGDLTIVSSATPKKLDSQSSENSGILLGKEKINRLKEALKKRRLKDRVKDSNEIFDSDFKQFQKQSKLKWRDVPKISYLSSEEEVRPRTFFGNTHSNYPIDLTFPKSALGTSWFDTPPYNDAFESYPDTTSAEDVTNDRMLLETNRNIQHSDPSYEESGPEFLYTVNSDAPVERTNSEAHFDTSHLKVSQEHEFWKYYEPQHSETDVKQTFSPSALENHGYQQEGLSTTSIFLPWQKLSEKTASNNIHPAEDSKSFHPFSDTKIEYKNNSSFQPLPAPKVEYEDKYLMGKKNEKSEIKVAVPAYQYSTGSDREPITAVEISQTTHVPAHPDNFLSPTPSEIKNPCKEPAAVSEITHVLQKEKKNELSEPFPQPKYFQDTLNKGQWMDQSELFDKPHTDSVKPPQEQLTVVEKESNLYQPIQFYQKANGGFSAAQTWASLPPESNTHHQLSSSLSKAVGLPKRVEDLRSRPVLSFSEPSLETAQVTAAGAYQTSGQSLNTLLEPSFEHVKMSAFYNSNPEEIMRPLLSEGHLKQTTSYQPSIEETIDTILRRIELSGAQIEPEIYVGKVGPPITVRHYAKPVIIEEHQRPYIIDHHQKAIIERHRPTSPVVVVDHYLPPEMFEFKDQFISPEVAKGHLISSEVIEKQGTPLIES